MTTIESLRARRCRVPLSEELVDARHRPHTHFEPVPATVGLDDGSEGTGCTWTGGRGGASILALPRHDRAPWLQGRDGAQVEALHDAMQAHLHTVGRGGVASFAISAVDIALWALRGRRQGPPLAHLAGGAADSRRAHCGGVDLAFDRARLWRIRPDASNCGGITGWLRVAGRARALGRPVCSRGMQQLHVGLVSAQPNTSWSDVHACPIDARTTRPLAVERHLAVAPGQPGIGFGSDWDRLAPLESGPA